MMLLFVPSATNVSGNLFLFLITVHPFTPCPHATSVLAREDYRDQRILILVWRIFGRYRADNGRHLFREYQREILIFVSRVNTPDRFVGTTLSLPPIAPVPLCPASQGVGGGKDEAFGLLG